MYRKNVASQFFCFQGVDATTGGIKSGVTWTVRRCLDGTFAAAGGTATEDGTTGWYKFALSQADTNGNDCSFNFTGTGAVPQTVNFVTTAADPTDAVRFGLTSLPNAAAGAASGLVINGSNTGPMSISGGVTFSNSAGDALTLSSSGSNGNGLKVSGNGTGSGANFQSGTGNGAVGLLAQSNAASAQGDGFRGLGSASGDGAALTGGTNGRGLHCIGGATTGAGFKAEATAGNSNAFEGFGQGSGDGFQFTGGATGRGLHMIGGATSGAGMRIESTAGNSNGVEVAGQGSGAGMIVTSGLSIGGFALALNGWTTGLSITSNVGAPIDSSGASTGDIKANLTGSVGSLAAQAKLDAADAVNYTQLTESYSALHVAPTMAQLGFEMRALLCENGVVGTTATTRKIDGATVAETYTINDASTPTNITRAT